MGPELLSCKVCMGRVTAAGSAAVDHNVIKVEVFDELSGVRFMKLEMRPEDFMLALTGMGFMAGKMELRGVHLVGCRRERKTELVPVPKGGPWEERDARAAAAVKELEKDGWVGEIRDGTNQHRQVLDHGLDVGPKFDVYSVSFSRYIDKDGKVVPVSG